MAITREEYFAQRDAALIQMAADGVTRKEAAERLGLSYSYLHQCAHKLGITFTRGYSHSVQNLVKRDRRAQEMASLYCRGGQTLEQIGSAYGITRERVRQIIKKVGVTGKDGSVAARGDARRQRLAAQREARCQEKYGCSIAELTEIKQLEKQMRADGCGPYQTPRAAYKTQRTNAIFRSIDWNLTFYQWWSIWQDSGKWAERGRGGYVMCRLGDSGAYEIGNAYIATHSHNSSVQPNNKNRLNHPEHADFIEKRAARRAEARAA